MAEGDKDFAGLLKNMQSIFESLPVPIIIKETGCGIAKEQYQILVDAGFYVYNCAGAGGTNFPGIEARRRNIKLSQDFAGWGLPTCWSLLDGQAVIPVKRCLLASGGIRTGSDVTKAFALGADAVGITAPILQLVMEQGVDAAVTYFESLAQELADYMLLLGCGKLTDLRNVPLIIGGETRNYIDCRGYNIADICKKRRQKH